MASFLSTLYFSRISHQTQKRFEKLFEKWQKSLKYKGLRRFKVGIFFVNAPQDELTKKMPTEKPEIFSGFLRFSPFSSLF